MTIAQEKLAKTGQAFSRIRFFVLSSNLCVQNVGVGVVLVNFGLSRLSRARARTTRAKTYITICWFTLLVPDFPRPKTMYPPLRSSLAGIET
jgi:hypothetical protein